jgi:hypothetical protein
MSPDTKRLLSAVAVILTLRLAMVGTGFRQQRRRHPNHRFCSQDNAKDGGFRTLILNLILLVYGKSVQNFQTPPDKIDSERNSDCHLHKLNDEFDWAQRHVSVGGCGAFAGEASRIIVQLAMELEFPISLSVDSAGS